MGKSALRIGLDLEQSSIAAVQIKSNKQNQVLTSAAVRALPEGLVFEGEVVDVDGLAAELKSFWKEAKLNGRRVNLGLANQKIVVRTMEFPPIDESELRAAIEFQAQEHIPIPVDEAVLDYQVLATYNGDDGAPRQKVLLVAAQKDMVRQFVEVAKKAGLTVEGIDLQAFALARALAPKGSFLGDGESSNGDGTVALANIGCGLTNLIVSVNGIPQFTRVINVGSDTLLQTLMNNRGIERAEADRLRMQVGLTGDGKDDTSELTVETVAEIHQVLDQASETFADEIRRSVDYYHTQEHDGSISKLVLTGDGSLTRNIAAYLSQALHLPVEIGNPLQEVGENKSKLSEAELEAVAPRLTIAIGLALDDEE